MPLLTQELQFHLTRESTPSLKIEQASLFDSRMKPRESHSSRHDSYSIRTNNLNSSNNNDKDRQPIALTHLDVVNGQLRIRKEEIKKKALFHNPNLPTMSLEEFAQLEYRDMLERERSQKEIEKNKTDSDSRYKYKQLVEQGKEDDEKLVNIATMEDRKWDDWKDENPRGSGNKAGKRF